MELDLFASAVEDPIDLRDPKWRFHERIAQMIRVSLFDRALDAVGLGSHVATETAKTSATGLMPSDRNQSTELARPKSSRGTSVCIIDSQITLPRISIGLAATFRMSAK